MPALTIRPTCRPRRTKSWRFRLSLMAALGGATSLSPAGLPVAQACGCLVVSDVSVPTVQAGERILFAQDSGTVTAIIQIQYQGKPGDFGWLVPLPAVPKNRLGQDGIDVSTDEVFTQLLATTGPSYTVNRINSCGFSGGGGGYGGGGVGCSSNSVAGAAPTQAENELPPVTSTPTPLVVQSSVGPYDFAVLKADSQTDMLKWLQDNRFVVPTGSDAAVSPYIRPGAYFLALKLRANLTAGAVQPVVLRYQSDYPMVPLTLTAVGAVPNMGIQVWILGRGRAIPRNYYHAVLNEAQLDLVGGVGNYTSVVTHAVADAPGKHAFVTDYSATSAVMVGLLDPPGRFARVPALSSIIDPYQYVKAVLALGSGFTVPSQVGAAELDPSLQVQPTSGALTTILSEYLPEPQSLQQRGVSLLQYYQRLSYYLQQDPQRGGPDYDATALKFQSFDPAAVTAELKSRIVTPTLEAGGLFRSQPHLTRLYTTLSPEDMNLDPVFGFNPGLPDVSLTHTATLRQDCSSRNTLDAGDGLHVDDWRADNPQLPYSLRIETLSETGEPKVITDHRSQIRSLAPFGRELAAAASGPDLQKGCSATPSRHVPVTAPLSLLGMAGGLLLVRRYRRRKTAGASDLAGHLAG